MNKWIIAAICLIIGMMLGSMVSEYWSIRHSRIVMDSYHNLIDELRYKLDVQEQMLELCEYREDTYIKNLEDAYDIDLIGGGGYK